LSAGGQNIDFQSVVVKYIDSAVTDTMVYNSSISSDNLTSTMFNYTEQRYVGAAPNSVLQVGELGIITINTTTDLGLREKGLIEIIPESGTMVMKEIIAPSSWGTKNYAQLFP